MLKPRQIWFTSKNCSEICEMNNGPLNALERLLIPFIYRCELLPNHKKILQVAACHTERTSKPP